MHHFINIYIFIYKYKNIFEFEIFSKFPVAAVKTKNNGNPSSVEYNINVN